MRLLTLATALVVVVALAVGWLAGRRPAAEPAPALDLADEPALGSEEAPVTVVEFGDYKCPYCRLFAETVFPLLKREYIETGKVRFYYVHYPFLGPDSRTAAMAAEFVYRHRPEAFWRYHHAIYAAQGDEREAWASPELLLSLAQNVDPRIDTEAMARALADEVYADEVAADLQMGRAAGVRGTPTVFVNGVRLPDPSYDTIRKAIEGALAKTR